MAVAKPSASSCRLSASPDCLTLMPLGRLFITGSVVDLLHRVAERRIAGEVGGDGRLALAVVAVDAGRTLASLMSAIGDSGRSPPRPIGTRICSSLWMSAASARRSIARGPGPGGRRCRTWPARARRRRWWRPGSNATGFRSRRRSERPDPYAAGCEARAGRARCRPPHWRATGCAASGSQARWRRLRRSRLSAPVTTSEIARRPLSSTNQ